MPHALQLLLLLALIIAAAKLAGALANRLKQPAVFGEILVGLILGPTVFDILGWRFFSEPGIAAEAGPPLLAIVTDLAHVGVILLMFVAGLETDVQEVRRIGHVAFWSATGGVVLPMVAGMGIAVLFGLPLFWQGIFVGVILTATSVSISAQTLLELGALRTREGSTILAAAVIDDIMGLLVLSVVVAFSRAGGGVDPGQLAWIVLRIASFFIGAVLLGRSFKAIGRWAERLAVSQGLLAIVVVVALLYAWAAEYWGGMAAITGSYVAGVLFAQTHFKKQIDEGIHPLTYSIFVPIFFISIGLRANGRELGGALAFTTLLVVVAIVTKVLGCGLLARLSGFTTRESVRVGVGMISRGEVGLIVAGYGLSNNIIGRDVFSAAVIVVLVTTMVTPPLLRLMFPGVVPHKVKVVEEIVVATPDELESHL